MNPSVTRRMFLRAGVVAAGWAALPRPAGAVEPFQRGGSARLRLSVAAYSFRQYFKDVSHEREGHVDPARRIDLFRFVDFCAEQDCDGAELTSYYFPPRVDAEFLIKLRRHAFLRGVEISGTAVGNTFTLPPGEKRDQEIALVKRWIDHATILGAPHVRVFAGSVPRGMEKAEARRLCLAALEECAEYAGHKGIFLGIENHGGLVAEAEDLLSIVRDVRSPWVGINLDTGNFRTDDPYADLARCAPYAVNVQLKGEIRRRGGESEPANLDRLIQILRDARYQGYVAIEYESAPDPWQAVPALVRECRRLIRG
ncbi:MAG TPA: sugar phosphate isomerase/epimerase family protein [Methylomirabilota bacterium]|nr:sugar phosphate isomerase/epimerase family protein [Methylomirabilota bacterium]